MHFNSLDLSLFQFCTWSIFMPSLQQAYGQESNYSADGNDSEGLFSALEERQYTSILSYSLFVPKTHF